MKQFIILLIAVLCFSCTSSEENLEIIPYPNYLIKKTGKFKVEQQTKIIIPDSSVIDVHAIAEEFSVQFRKVSGIDLSILPASQGKDATGAIVFRFNSDLDKEAYNLTITKQRVVIEASHDAGFFYAIQTIKQLFPEVIYGKELVAIEWTLPCLEIKDAPRFKYRGMHLDVARHFFNVEEVKRYIDILALHKLNTFHWHLTDDQGWRIEIKKYPKLTSIGGWRKGTVIEKKWGNYDNIAYGGFYTQEEIREVVDYAAQHFITVIPEIDLPGHMVAALASYPHLGCLDKNYEVYQDWGVSNDVLCVGKESTFDFLEGVMAEVMELFPSEYIHIGGDECPKTRWEKCPHCQRRIKELGLKTDERYTTEHYLQSYAISRIGKFLNDHGRKIIGWDELLEGGIAPNATIMSWRGIDGGIEAARQHHDVIMTSNSHFYFDYYQSLDTENEPFGFGGYVPVEKVYSFNPQPEVLNEDEQKHIIGVQANLWTEYIKTNEHLEYMLLPRLAALSEVQWTQDTQKDWKRFLNNTGHIVKIYDAMGYNYAKHIFEISSQYSVDPDKKGVLVTLETQGDTPIFYSIDGSEIISYKKPVSIDRTCIFRADVKRENMQTRSLTRSFVFNKATGCQIEMHSNPKEKFVFAGAPVLVDGLRGSLEFDSGYWLGFESDPLDVTITFPELTNITSVNIGSLINIGAWIFPPVSMEVYNVGNDNAATLIKREEFPTINEKDKDLVEMKEYGCSFSKIQAKKLRVRAEPQKSLPKWHGGKGQKAFLFIDELIIE